MINWFSSKRGLLENIHEGGREKLKVMEVLSLEIIIEDRKKTIRDRNRNFLRDQFRLGHFKGLKDC